MKKTVSLLLAILYIITIIPLSVSADMGVPSGFDQHFDDWSLVVGVEGVSIRVVRASDSQQINQNSLEPGTKFDVNLYSELSDTYLCSIKGDLYFYISADELENKCIAEDEVVSKEVGKKQSQVIKGKVNTEDGINLRRGPSTAFSSQGVIPFETQISYQFTYSADGINWAYVNYNGKDGWCSTDYIEKTSMSSSVASSSSQSKVSSKTDVSSSKASVPSTSSYASHNTKSTIQKNGFFDNTTNVIVVALVGAVILAAAAVVTVIFVAKKKD